MASYWIPRGVVCLNMLFFYWRSWYFTEENINLNDETKRRMIGNFTMFFDNFERTLFKAIILLWYDKCKIKIQCTVEI